MPAVLTPPAAPARSTDQVLPPAPEPASEPAPEPSGRSPWRALRHRSMRWWSLANLVSNVGTWMQLTVQNLLVLQITGSAAATGLSLSVQAAPGLLLGLLMQWAGVRGALVAGGLLIAAVIGAGALHHRDKIPAPTRLRRPASARRRPSAGPHLARPAAPAPQHPVPDAVCVGGGEESRQR